MFFKRGQEETGAVLNELLLSFFLVLLFILFCCYLEIESDNKNVYLSIYQKWDWETV